MIAAQDLDVGAILRDSEWNEWFQIISRTNKTLTLREIAAEELSEDVHRDSGGYIYATSYLVRPIPNRFISDKVIKRRIVGGNTIYGKHGGTSYSFLNVVDPNMVYEHETRQDN